MRRRWVVLFAVVAAVLVATAQPAAAANVSGQLAVASQHTDFGTGTEPAPTATTNMSVIGSGDSADVALDAETTSSLVDSFEDGDIAEYSGDTNIYSASTNYSSDGSWSLYGNDDAGWVTSTSGLPAYPDQGENFLVDVLPDKSVEDIRIGWAQDGSEGYVVKLDNGDNRLAITRNGPGISPTTIKAGSQDTINFSNYAGEWLTVNISWGTNGQIDVSVIDANGTTLASLSAEDTTYSDGGIAFSTFQGNTYIDNIRTKTKAASNGTYIGAPHSGGGIKEGWTNLTLQNASATVTWQEDGDGDGTWANVTSASYSSSGNVTADLSGTSSSWRVRVDVEQSSGETVAKISDEGILFNSSSPTADMASATPAGKTTSSPVNVSVPVSDPDFSTAQGDSVDVEIQVRPSGGSFSTISTQTISSNQSVSAQFTPTDGGDYDYRVVMTDSYGATVTSATQTFSTPAQLTVFRETYNATKISSVNVTIRFYPTDGTGQVVTKTTTNGVVKMTGLPVTTSFVATANASGFESRRIFIRSLYEQQRLYLLNTSVDSVKTIFEMRDYTGKFPPDSTVLEVRRSINGDWQTVSGDYFGATSQYPTTLETGARYRLRLYNPETGATRPLGTYQPIAAQTQTIEVSPHGEIDEIQSLPYATIRPQTRRVPALNNTQISASLSESQVEGVTVNSWRVTVVQNSTTIINQTYSGSTREANLSADLSNYTGDVGVSVVATLSDGRTITAGSATLRVYDSPANNLSLLALAADFVGLAAPGTAGALTSFLATVITVFAMAGVSTQLPVSGETTGLVGVLVLTAFSVIGWVGYDVVFVAGSAVVGLAALRRGL